MAGMRMSILAFATGVWLCQQMPALPTGGDWLVLVAALGMAAALGRAAPAPLPRRLLATLAAALAGFGYAAALGASRLGDSLPPALEGQDLTITGIIASLPQDFERGVRFEFAVDEPAGLVPRRLWLAWYRGRHDDEATAPPAVLAGQRWQLSVRLKRPHGNLNPHGQDYEAWLFERGLRATGHVRRGENRRLAEFVPRPVLAVERLRQRLRQRFTDTLGEAPYAGVLTALAIGDQRAIPAGQWQVFNRTGTTHLMSISGLHVTMLAALGYALVAALWRRVPRWALAVAVPRAAAAGGWAVALGYALLAGFGIPAQRTLYMLSVVALALWLSRDIAVSRVLALALLLVLLLDPWAVASPGFWLSFGAVAVLLFVAAGRLGEAARWRQWLATQWAVTLAMIPALLALFQQFSLASPLANLIAIPLVSLVVTPLALAAAVLPFDALLWLAHVVLAGLMTGLEWLAATPLAVWQQAAPAAWTVILGLAGVLAMLLPRGLPGRWLGLVMLLPLLTTTGSRPADGTARVTVLDVGQGLAVHVQTSQHDLIYDAGPQFSAEANSGNRIIVPYLRAVGVGRLDTLVVSHDDNDHAGGAAAVMEGVATGSLLHGLPQDHALLRGAVPARRCTAGQAWEWDGVRFRVLHPGGAGSPAGGRPGNNGSCVLHVAAADGSLLLAGDIEAAAEAELLAAAGPTLGATVLVAPHHGSRSSSSPAFVAAVAPQAVVFSVGYRSRFGHPHPEVQARYGPARLLRTDLDGALTADLGRGGLVVARERERRRRYWHAP